MAIAMTLTIALSVINIILIVGLLYVYGKNFLKIKSGFTAGLFIFAFLFFIHNILYIYFSAIMMQYYADSAQLYGLIFSFLQTIAFLILNIITWK